MSGKTLGFGAPFESAFDAGKIFVVQVAGLKPPYLRGISGPMRHPHRRFRRGYRNLRHGRSQGLAKE